MPQPHRIYGLRKDVSFSHPAVPRYEALGKPTAASVDLRKEMPPVYDQGMLGSCTAQALAGAAEYVLKNAWTPSRLYIYYNERQLQGTVNSDSGSTIGTGITSMLDYGVCPETLWPYIIPDFKLKPNPDSYVAGKKDILLSFTHMVNLQAVKEKLDQKIPVAFGFQVYGYMESEMMAQTGVLRLPETGEKYLGGHAVLAVGYDDSAEMLIVRNSWGPHWGQYGYFMMPYKYAENPALAGDFFSVEKFGG